MKAAELRLRNLVYEKHCDGSVHVGEVAEIGAYETHIGWHEKVKTKRGWFAHRPIPLTEEWLSKLGIARGFFKNNSLFSIRINEGVFYNQESQICNCEYVHQLQNIHFALTGEEL